MWTTKGNIVLQNIVLYEKLVTFFLGLHRTMAWYKIDHKSMGVSVLCETAKPSFLTKI